MILRLRCVTRLFAVHRTFTTTRLPPTIAVAHGPHTRCSLDGITLHTLPGCSFTRCDYVLLHVFCRSATLLRALPAARVTLRCARLPAPFILGHWSTVHRSTRCCLPQIHTHRVCVTLYALRYVACDAFDDTLFPFIHIPTYLMIHPTEMIFPPLPTHC